MQDSSDRPDPLTIIAWYRARPDAVDSVREVLERHAAASEAEPGCRQFAVHQGLDDPTCFALVEEYSDEAAFDEHRRSAHFRRNIEGAVASWLVEREWRRFGPRL